jgi:hypothetical protein
VVVSWLKVAATSYFVVVLVSPSLSQQTGQTVARDRLAASAFERAMQAEAGPPVRRIRKKRFQDFCAGDARHWGDGIVGYARVTFASEQELASKMLTLVHQWKTTGSQDPVFDASDFPRLRRYAVADCGVVDGQTKVAVAVYRSAWDTYWARWANLLGR